MPRKINNSDMEDVQVPVIILKPKKNMAKFCTKTSALFIFCCYNVYLFHLANKSMIAHNKLLIFFHVTIFVTNIYYVVHIQGD